MCLVAPLFAPLVSMRAPSRALSVFPPTMNALIPPRSSSLAVVVLPLALVKIALLSRVLGTLGAMLALVQVCSYHDYPTY